MCHLRFISRFSLNCSSTLQTFRTAFSYSNSHPPLFRAFYYMRCAKLLQSCLTLCDSTDCSCQAPLSMGFSRQEYWSGFACSPPGHLPDPRIEPASLKSPVLSDGFFTTCTTVEGSLSLCMCVCMYVWVSSVQFSCSLVCDSLRPHEPQHTRPPCPSPTPRVHTNPCPLSR